MYIIFFHNVNVKYLILDYCKIHLLVNTLSIIQHTNEKDLFYGLIRGYDAVFSFFLYYTFIAFRILVSPN